jgi:hypothetical protein
VNPICPTCGSDDVHHSRPRTFTEKLRSQFSEKVPFRCYACGWRDWLSERSVVAAAPPAEVHKPPPEPQPKREDPTPPAETDADVIRR